MNLLEIFLSNLLEIFLLVLGTFLSALGSVYSNVGLDFNSGSTLLFSDDGFESCSASPELFKRYPKMHVLPSEDPGTGVSARVRPNQR